MTATKHYGWILLVFITAVSLLVGCGSSGDDTFNPDAIPPAITGLNRNAADIGQDVVISGLRFGQTMGESSVSLNGADFQVSEGNWGDTQLTVTVAQGMTSGIVVVTVEGVSSQSGPEAQLFIPTAPTGAPLIGAVSPDFGTEGFDEVLVSGFNFGDGTGDSGVYFPAQSGAVSQGGGVVLAPVVNVEINAELVPQWSNSTIKVQVPDNSQSGMIYVLVDGVMSNEVAFTVLPKQLSGPPVIFEQSNDPPGITPDTGGVNSAVIISGENFGGKQGSSVITLNDLPMAVITWTTDEIAAMIPVDAETGPIRVTVGGQSAESAVFSVENQPYITGLNPSVMRVGQSLTITGQYFGIEQGTGKLKVGNTAVSVDTWADNQITVAELPALTYSDSTQVPVQVTVNSGKSHTAYGSVETPLIVYVLTPNPNQGEAGTTTFNMFVTVVGGSGNYQYTFIPNDDEPGVMNQPTNSLPMEHMYLEGDVSGPTDFDTLIKVKDLDTSDEVIVAGPMLSVVPKGQAVIMSMEVLDFNYASAMAPRNDWTYTRVPPLLAEIAYNDFTFFGGDIYYGSALSEFDDGGTPVTGFTRDIGGFMSGSPTARPYGYRYADSQGSVVRITGLNLGVTGEIYLDSDGTEGSDLGTLVDAADILAGSWTPESIDFYLPQDKFENLSGQVAVVTPTSSVLSSTNLICSAFIRDILPDGAIELSESFSISGYDFEPPQVPGMTGPDTYFIFVVQADYLDPFTGLGASGSVLLSNPLPANPSTSQVQFDLTTFPTEGQVEVINSTFDQAEFELGTVKSGPWQAFLWTGALSSGTDFEKANSGIFSESFDILTTDGTGPVEFWEVSGASAVWYDFSGDPIPGVHIFIRDISGTGYEADMFTDAAGLYAFPAVPGGFTYEAWGEHASYIWPVNPRNVGLGPLIQDETTVHINPTQPAP